MSNLFRKEALDQIGTVDESNKLVKIITTPGWLALTGLIILIIVTVIWGIFGSVTTQISGQGIIIKHGGIFSIVSNGSGQVLDVNVNQGDFVKKGDVIATINQPELNEKIRITELQLEKEKDEFEKEKVGAETRFSVRRNYLEKQKEIVTNNISNYESRLDYLSEQLQTQKELLDEGLITGEEYESVNQQKQELQLKIQQTKNELVQTEYDLLQLENQKDELLQKSENSIDELQRELQILNSQIEVAGKITSSFEGFILELNIYPGSNVTNGITVASIESNESDLFSMIYLSPFEGKKVVEDMNVQIIPSNVAKEEAGFIHGKVTNVSKFPLSTSAMKATIDNEGLIGLFTKAGPPIAVTVKLLIEESTDNLMWSSSGSNDINITPGTLCAAQITIKEQSPLSLVLPYFRKIF